jgi:ubiquinone/menaquinone biosynthesis C-methylase UbiE
MVQAMTRSLKPGGRMVFVEFRAEDPKVPIKAVHKMSEAQVRKEMSAHSLQFLETNEVLPWQHIFIFQKSR